MFMTFVNSDMLIPCCRVGRRGYLELL